MRKVAAVVLVLFAFASYAGKGKGVKVKEKRFEPVAVHASGVTGSYRGPSESYGLILDLAADGTLRGNYVEMGRVAVLNAIALDGAELTARASFDDGSSRTITGTVSIRVLNGTTAFGIRLRGVPVEGLGTIDTFFERF